MKKIKSLIIRIFLYSFLFLLLFPLLVLVLESFSKNWTWPDILPSEFSLRGFQDFTRQGKEMLHILLLSIFLSSIVTLTALLISIPAARALGLLEFKGKKFINILLLAPVIVPVVSVSMGIHLTFIKLRLANTFSGVVLVHLLPCLPYGIRILSDVFEITGDKMEQQARVLGADSFQIFLYITLPVIMPGIISAGSLIFIVSFSQYFLTFLIGGGRIITLPMIMFPYIQSGDKAIAAGYSLVFLAASLLFLTFFEKAVKSYYRIENHFYI